MSLCYKLDHFIASGHAEQLLHCFACFALTILMRIMAELVSELDELTVCLICFRQFDSPRVLPCEHTFCVKCLNEHILASTDRDSAQKTFNCPMCRTNLPVLESGAADFPLNRAISNLQEAVTRKQNRTDQKMCPLCANNVSEKFCIECKNSLCRQCSKIHDKLPNSENHSVYLISELEATGQIFEFSSEFCKSHGNEKVQFFCKRCDDVICLRCRLTTHHTAEHVCTDLCDKNAEWKAELMNCEQEFVSMEDSISTEMARLLKMKTEECSRYETSLTRLHENKEKLINEITEYYSQIEAEICNAGEVNTKEADKEMEKIKQKNDLVQHMKNMCTFHQRFSSSIDLMKGMKTLQSRISDHEDAIMSGVPLIPRRLEFRVNEKDDNRIQALVGDIICEEEKIQHNNSADTDVTPSDE